MSAISTSSERSGLTTAAPADAAPSAAPAEEMRLRAAYARRQDADRYSWFNEAHLLSVQERARATIALLRRHGIRSLADVAILEIGCGRGVWLRELIQWGATPANIVGIDVLEDRIDDARRLCPPGVTLMAGNAATLDLPANRYDIVLQSMVFTSVLDASVRQAIARRMLSTVRPQGLILWYDYHVNNPRNPDVRGVRRREIEELFPGCRIELTRVTLAAPLARAVAPRSRAAYALLRMLPMLRTHYLGAIRKP